MKPSTLAFIGVAAALLGGAAVAYAATQRPTPPPAPVACAPGAKLSFICGIRAPEDLVQIPGSNWIIASGLIDAARPGSGGLYLIDTTSKKAIKQAFPAVATARPPYNNCISPPNAQRFSAHGLSIRPQGAGRATLFVVGHGEREAIEVYDVASGGPQPKLSWIGCIPAPAGASINSVAAIADGRVLATNFYQAPLTMNDALRGTNTGWVLSWRPGGVFEKVGGTDLPGPNGIEVTPDNRWLFVAVTGTSQVLRFDLNDTWRAPTFVRPNLRADNLRWAPDGKLLLAGPGPIPGGTNAAMTAPAVVALDPTSLKTTDVLRIPAEPAFPGHAAALIVGKTLWLGSYTSDRVAYTSLP